MDKLRALRSYWGLFCRKDLKIILCAPPKCGSTSIFNALSAVGVGKKVDLNKYNGTKEYLHELKIHSYVRDILPEVEELSSYFSDSSFLKVLVIRDPLERLVSAVLSKYLVPNSHFYREISDFDLDLRLSYESPEQFSIAFNEVVRALILKGLSSESRLGSHVDPIARRYNNYVRSCFDITIDISHGSNGFANLHEILGDHIKKTSGVSLPAFKRLNESPLKTNVKFLNRENIEKSLIYFEEDYRSFPFSPPIVSEWVQEYPKASDLEQLNMFLGLVSRFSEVFNRSSELENLIKEKNSRLESFNTNCQDQAKELKQAIMKHDELKQQIKDVITEKKAVEKTVDELNKHVSAQAAELETERKEREAEKEATQSTIKELSQQLEHSSALLIEKREEVKTFSAQLEDLIREKNSRQESFDTNCQDQAKELMQTIKKHDELKQQVKDVVAEKKAVEKTVEELNRHVSAQAAELETERKEREAEKEATQNTIEELSQQLEHTSALLIEKQAEAKTLSEEVDLTLRQLHQVQEELEYYFYESRSKDELLQKHQDQQQSVKRIISKMLLKR